MTTIPSTGGGSGIGPGPAALLLTTAAPEQSRCFSFCLGSKILLSSFANTGQHILPEDGWRSQPLCAVLSDLSGLPTDPTSRAWGSHLKASGLVYWGCDGFSSLPTHVLEEVITLAVMTYCFERPSLLSSLQADKGSKGTLLGCFVRALPWVPHLFWFGYGLGNLS